MKSLLPLLGLCMLLALIGCTTQTKTPAENKSPAEPEKKEEKSQVKKATAADKKAVELQVVKLGDFLDVLKQQKGKIVVINFWATWCTPCRAAFPRHVELHKKYHDKDVVCMSISFDELKVKDKALQFLEKQKATFPNFLPDEDETAWRKHWDINPIPATMVYDASGTVHRFTHAYDNGKGFSPADVEKLVEKLVKN